MNKLGEILLFLVLLFLSTTMKAAVFTATANGDWNLGTTWGGACGGGCVAGVDFPGAGDDAIVPAGVLVSIPFFGDETCRNITLDANTAGSLNMNFASTLNITGTLLSNNVPTVAIVTNAGGQFNFTGVNTGTSGNPFALLTDILVFWNSVAPLPICNFNLVGTKSISGTNGTVTISGALNLNSGTLQDGQFITDLILSGSNTLTIATGATLNLTIPLSGGTNSTNINSLSINGILTTTNYVNTSNFSMGASSSFTTSYSAGTEGWWHDNSSLPTFGTMDALSTITYSSSSNQAVAAVDYGNLTLSGAGNKTIDVSGTLKVLGTLDLTNNNVTLVSSVNPNPINIGADLINDGNWSPSQLVNFNGGVAQNITGNNVVAFGGGVRISNTLGTVQLFSQDVDINGPFDINPSAVFNPNGRQVNLSADLVIDGVLSPSGTFVFDGTTNVSGGGSAAFNNVTITGNLTSNGQSANIAGNFTNNGTFSNINGTVNFNGANPQSITGSSPTNFNNVTINSTDGGAGVTLSSTATLLNKLTLGSSIAKFNAGSSLLTLLSPSVSSNARIGALPTPANFTGSVIIERYVSSPSEDYRYFSIPVTNGNLGMWSDDFAVTGNFSDANNSNPNVIDPAAASVYSFNNSTQAWVAADGGGGTLASFSLSNTSGYSAWTYANSDFTISVSGTIGKGNNTVATTSGDNLVGNPYPATIGWDNITRTNVNNTVYIRTGNNVFASYSAGAGSGTGHPDVSWAGEISQGQAFWAIGTAAGSLAMTENSKTDAAIQHVRSSTGPYNQIRIILEGNDQKDETIIYFREDATIGFEDQYDGAKKKNGSVVGCTACDHINLSSYNTLGDKAMVFNAIPFGSNCSASSKLKVEDVPSGIYSLNFSDLETMEFGVVLTLKDNFLNKTIDILNNDSYSFEVTGDIASFGDARFELFFASEAVIENPVYSYQSNCDNISTILIADSQLGVEYALSDNTGTIASSTGNGNTLTINISNADLSIGNNLLDLSIDNQGCSNVQLVDYISFDIIEKEEVTKVTDGNFCGSGTVLLKAEGATGNGSYRWYESNDIGAEAIVNETSSEFLTPILESSKDYYVVIINEAGCESAERRKISAVIKPLPSSDFLYPAPDLCNLLNGGLGITNAIIGATYRLVDENGEIASTGDGIDTNRIFTLNEQSVLEGANVFDMLIEMNGCTSEVLDAITFNYYSLSVISVVNNNVVGCENSTVTLVADGAKGNEHYNWYESDDSAVEPIPNEVGPEYIATELTIDRSYFVSIVNENGCETSREQIAITVIYIDTPIITKDESKGILSTIEDEKFNYQWYKDGGEMLGETKSSLVLLETGNYEVEVSVSGCSKKSNTERVDSVLGLKELNDLGINIYPNPVVDKIHITNSNKIESLIIYDTKGVAVFRSGKTIPAEINLTSIRKGIYIINIATDTKTINYRFRKQ